jgi:hypothetical protein
MISKVRVNKTYLNPLLATLIWGLMLQKLGGKGPPHASFVYTKI